MLSLARTASTLVRRVAALSLAAFLLGCGVNVAAEGADMNGAGGTGGAPPYSGITLAFLDAAVLLIPGETRELTLETLPPAARTVRLSLVGDSQDAFLDQSEIVTGDDGIGKVRLTAPTSPATFQVRASLENGPHAELTASTGEAFGTIRVIPRYDGRPVTEWTATAATGRECTTQIPPPDGAISVEQPLGTDLDLAGVPLGVPLTVTARAGHFAGGCVNIEGILTDGITTVEVDVVDRPLQMTLASFDVHLGEDSVEWQGAFEPVIQAMLAAILGDAPSDASRVLDVMAEANVDAASFQTARDAGNWDALLTDALGENATDGLRRAVREQVMLVLERFIGPDVISGRLIASATSFERASLDITAVAGIPGAVAGFPSSVAATWSASRSDTVSIGAELTWDPSKLLTALADAQAETTEGGAASLAAAQFGCATLAEKLASVGTGGLAYAMCDATCVAGACQTAVRSLWELAQTAQTSGNLKIAAYGSVRIDDEAVPIGFDGNWVGDGTVGPGQVIYFEGPAVGGELGN